MRFVCALLLAAIAIAIAPAVAGASKPPSLYMALQDGITNTYELVEQQSCDENGCWHQYGSEGTVCSLDPLPEIVVCNNTVDPLRSGRKCLWDVDDHTGLLFLGDYLPARASASLTKCIIGDTGWVFGIEGHEGVVLRITLRLDTGQEWSVETRTKACIGGPRIRSDSLIRQVIPDSNGGTGVPGTVTWSVINDSDRAARFGRMVNIAAGSGNLGMDTYDDRWCPSGFPLFNTGEGGFDADGIGIWRSVEVP